ncbi:MAG: hypothetical protein ACLFRT_12060, partial [Actinomycetota bacterium]
MAISRAPEVTLRGGTPAQHRRLDEALHRFERVGLLLPDLEVEFHQNLAECGGHHGLFRPDGVPWRITICSGVDSVYEHELAHAWELANASDATRREFMRLRGYSTWNDGGVAWNERGIEGAASVVQQGLSGLPLPPH